ncbi:hypothetical protein LH392_00220 [Corynebacterium uberis]|uniref:hypothetical protein n=1 Tax=Corynebacterium TaxID=1716 RepID=UPI001D0AA9B9|nr:MULTISPECIES: hypothetical protein [Corynebacterium]MCZ9310346.1 hypothetical protein [Corynebacterium sp. c6VSa_13]UDL75791.1 hypothetical protein LH393_11335 [Corynebacterium uberis]UDL80286.1 hypothetical protein LH392_00220 [Corynebacterium uberis]UDL84628.1 hypothetical protein LH390_11320 [Corynebacterium uberis]
MGQHGLSPVAAKSAGMSPHPPGVAWWINFIGVVAGLVATVGLIAASQDLSWLIGRVGYVPGMFFYMISMIIAAAVMVGSFISLWTKLTRH